LQALALCEQLEKLASGSGVELMRGAQTLPELRLAFEAIGEFPRAEARAVRSRFERTYESCERAVAEQRARDGERSWDSLFEAGAQVGAYQLALIRGSEGTQADALKQAAENYIAGVERWPKGGLEAIKHALEHPGSADLAANEVALKMLCIRAEILSDVPTPPEDQPLRREYQVKRLMEHMGQGISPADGELDAIAIEWVGAGPVAASVYGQLLGRFRRCRERQNSAR
jgi:hypothetical protein